MSTKTAARRAASEDSTLRHVPITSLRTSLGALRRGRTAARRRSLLEDLPIRVVAVEDDGYEVVDGFKRLERLRAAGAALVPVLVDAPGSGPELKRRLLEANAPPRTVGPLDEAEVVRSLVEEDKLTIAAAARVLEKRPHWAERRYVLATRLSPRLAARLAHGTVGPTVALALAPFPHDEQDALALAAERAELPAREVLALTAAWRATEDEDERRALLDDPRGRLAPLHARATLTPLGPRARSVVERLDAIEDALRDLVVFELPQGLTDAEQRRLEARLARVHHQLRETARVLGVEDGPVSPMSQEEEPDDGDGRRSGAEGAGGGSGSTRPEAQGDPARGAGGDPQAREGLRGARDREAGRPFEEAREERPRGGEAALGGRAGHRFRRDRGRSRRRRSRRRASSIRTGSGFASSSGTGSRRAAFCGRSGGRTG